MTLTEKQLRFVDEYLKDSNATQAALRAGYAEKTAYNSGYANTKKREIIELLDQRRAEMKDKLQKQFASDAIEARKVMFHIMQNDEAPEHVRLSAAKDFLDRAGYKPVDKQDINTTGDIGIEVKWSE